MNRRKTENINPVKNIFNDVNLFSESNPIDTHKFLVFHLIRPQLGRMAKNNMNVIMVPIILKLLELISRLNKYKKWLINHPAGYKNKKRESVGIHCNF